MSVDIDPITGAPIVKSETSNFTPTNDAPTTQGDTTQAPQEASKEAQTQSAQAVQPMEVEMLPPPEVPTMPAHLRTKNAFKQAVLEVTSRHCSDSVSRVKCADEVAALLPDW